MRTRFYPVAVVVIALSPFSQSFAKPQAAKAPLDEAIATPSPAAIASPTPAASPSPAAGPKSATRPTPPSVIPFEKLIPFLPEVPTGWTADKPSGSITEIEVFNLSTATQTYFHGDEENAPVVTVTIIDAGGHKGYFDTTTVQWKMGQETPDSYDKLVEIDGMPGYEHYNKKASSGSLSVIVGKRFFVQIDVTNQGSTELREWLKRIDLKKLAELK